MSKAINTASITQEATKYDKQLRFLPYYFLEPELNNLGISMIQEMEHIATEAVRKGGLLRPYVAGNIENQDDLLGFEESKFKPEIGYVSVKDNIQNYKNKRIMNNPSAGTGIHKTKEHPLKKLVTSSVVKTVSEDVLDNVFHGIRNTSLAEPTAKDSFNGFNFFITEKIGEGKISADRKNVITTGEITGGTGAETQPIDQVVQFVRAASPFLRKKGYLYMTGNTYLVLMDALEYKMSNKSWDFSAVEAYINIKADAQIKIKKSPILGTGSGLILTEPGNLEFGMDTRGDHQFIQVRNPYEDPNLVQFWLQAAFGTRIRSVHYKNFMMNEQSFEPTNISGDF